MFDRFGEFNSAEELNRAAAAQLAEGDTEAIFLIADENGIDREDAEDYIDGVTEVFVTPLMAALGKLSIEADKLKPDGIVKDWKDYITECCMESEEISHAVRKKGKALKYCMAALIKLAFENKVQISDEIVNEVKVECNGKLEAMRKPLYLGIPNKAEVKRIIREYYLG